MASVCIDELLVFATQPAPDLTEKEIRFAAGKPMDYPTMKQYITLKTWMDYADMVNSKMTAFGAVAIREGASPRSPRRSIGLLQIEEGDIVPVFGYLYRVAKITKNSKGKGLQGSDFMIIQWLSEKDSPGKLAVQMDSFVIPLGGGAGWDGTYFRVYKIDISNAVGKMPTATLGYSGGISVNSPNPADRALVRKDDVLMVGDEGYQVRAVVPRDAKTGIIGWVELASTPIPEDELKNHKSVVRPMPPR